MNFLTISALLVLALASNSETSSGDGSLSNSGIFSIPQEPIYSTIDQLQSAPMNASFLFCPGLDVDVVKDIIATKSEQYMMHMSEINPIPAKDVRSVADMLMGIGNQKEAFFMIRFIPRNQWEVLSSFRVVLEIWELVDVIGEQANMNSVPLFIQPTIDIESVLEAFNDIFDYNSLLEDVVKVDEEDTVLVEPHAYIDNYKSAEVQEDEDVDYGMLVDQIKEEVSNAIKSEVIWKQLNSSEYDFMVCDY